jgi:hypothetical protein
MRRAAVASFFALIIGAAMLPGQELLAADCNGNVPATSGHSTSRSGIRGWVSLHRPDGEVVRIKVEQIVFVMSAAKTGANSLALSRLQLLNGFVDVREDVESVMLLISVVEGASGSSAER